jgi:DNA-binding NarL/FixJ family response regulator
MTNTKDKITLALADDHTMFRKGLAHLINIESDMEVVAEAGDGVDLLQKIAALKTPPDLCILDVNMPRMDGRETIMQLRKNYPTIRVLVLSMVDHEHILIEMLRQGAGGYLLKEDDPAEMKQAIRSIYEHKYYHSDLVSGRMINWIQKDSESPGTLSDREREFLRLCVSELVYKEIAVQMGVSTRAVHNYRDQLFQKLNLKSRIGLALYALKVGIAEVND